MDNLAYQEEWTEELIDGKVVAMSPAAMRHVFVAGNIYGIFLKYLDGKTCVPIQDGGLVFLTEKDHFVPDFMIVCDPNKIRDDGVHGAPDLVVEVLSPSTAKIDRTHKKEVYGKCGVREYWIVSPSEKTVEVFRNRDGELVLHDIYTLCAEPFLRRMSEAERAAIVTHFKCSLYDDLEISLFDIFKRIP